MEIVKLLREFTMKEKRIPVEGGKARFDGLEFDLKTELPLKGAGSKYYKLEVRTYVTPLHARVLARAEAAGVWFCLCGSANSHAHDGRVRRTSGTYCSSAPCNGCST